jgi:hypothetical protein
VYNNKENALQGAYKQMKKMCNNQNIKRLSYNKKGDYYIVIH